ncbi:hypothetical protein EPUS_08013 [Endocarpon pusillum Z07020]|uniref:40S ribosomal protein S8 n=2 Tax=Endocarpon pusillum TaxID=364733 RepID=U1FY26_ENDPU|nr:uncharacterized protein EPUS_08013 [Endocarpon pusillum Z07020]ERF69812.1 hypothetical protein EPUS_08013 [Endocarpon pusillum Z07020]
MGISRDSRHKRSATGAKRAFYRKKRAFEKGRQPANTRIGNKRIHLVRTRGGNTKYRALRLEAGNFSWGSEGIARKVRVIVVAFHPSNNELVRTNTLTKSAVVQIDAAPFRQWYEAHYGVQLGRRRQAKGQETEESKKSKSVEKKHEERVKKMGKVEQALEKQFEAGRLYAVVSSRPGQSGRVDGYVLEGEELAFYQRAIRKLFVFLRVLKRKDTTIEEKARLLLNILRAPTQINRFPTSCAIIIGGATLLPRIAVSILLSLRRTLNLSGTYGRHDLHTRSIRIICTFLSALLAFTLLNHDDCWSRKRASSQGLSQLPEPLDLPSQHHLPTQLPPRLAGKTIDFTLFTTTRALSVLVITLWTGTQSSRYHPTHTNPQFAKFLTKAVDPAIFSLSAALIMHAWFYHPHRLPRSYNHWIHQAANIDRRFLQALRLARSGAWQYGLNNSRTNHLLRGVAADLHLPESYGDPALSIPIKCELIHSGCGPSSANCTPSGASGAPSSSA